MNEYKCYIPVDVARSNSQFVALGRPGCMLRPLRLPLRNDQSFSIPGLLFGFFGSKFLEVQQYNWWVLATLRARTLRAPVFFWLFNSKIVRCATPPPPPPPLRSFASCSTGYVPLEHVLKSTPERVPYTMFLFEYSL